MAQKTLNITLHVSELTFDIMNGTDLTAKSKHTDAEGGNDEQVAHMTASEDEWSMNHILRSIQGAVGDLRIALNEYLNDNNTDLSDKLMSGNDKIVFNLIVPANFNFATKQGIASLMHDYIVNSAIAKWFNTTAPNETETYFALAGKSLQHVKQAINKRIRPKRQAPLGA